MLFALLVLHAVCGVVALVAERRLGRRAFALGHRRARTRRREIERERAKPVGTVRGRATPHIAVDHVGAGVAEAVAVPGGGPPGRTTTRVPTLVRSNRSETSSLSMPMQPDETNLPIVEGWLVPWMRYTVEPRYIARAPSGLPGPPAMKRGR